MIFLVFLDFDGVLHSHWGPHSERFYFLPRFEAVLRDFPLARIVIASSWQLTHDLPALRSYFAPDIQPRVIGVSSVTNEQALTWYGKRHRIAAAHRFLKTNGYEHLPWVAIDDEPSFWQPGAPLIHCRDGFQDIEEQLLRWVLSNKVSADPGSLSFMDNLLRIDLRGNLAQADLAQRLYAKYWKLETDEMRDWRWFESVCATDPEFTALLIDETERIGTTSSGRQGSNMRDDEMDETVECGRGWKSLYEPLIERCKAEGVAVLQVKEKFGGLRFYAGGGTDDLFDAIDEAQSKSFTICEQCGSPGELRKGACWKTLCDQHAQELNRNRR